MLSLTEVISQEQAQVRQDSKSKAGKSGCLHVRVLEPTGASAGLKAFKLRRPALPHLQKGGPSKILLTGCGEVIYDP